jgi:hypothetical protein
MEASMNPALPICPYCKKEVSGVTAINDEHTGITIFLCPACHFVLGVSASPTKKIGSA